MSRSWSATIYLPCGFTISYGGLTAALWDRTIFFRIVIVKTAKRQLQSWYEKGLTFESSFAFYHYFRKTKIIRKQLYNATYNMENLTIPCWILRSLYQNKKCHFLVRGRILVSILYLYLLNILCWRSSISS